MLFIDQDKSHLPGNNTADAGFSTSSADRPRQPITGRSQGFLLGGVKHLGSDSHDPSSVLRLQAEIAREPPSDENDIK